MATTRRTFLAFVGAAAATPALAHTPAPAPAPAPATEASWITGDITLQLRDGRTVWLLWSGTAWVPCDGRRATGDLARQLAEYDAPYGRDGGVPLVPDLR